MDGEFWTEQRRFTLRHLRDLGFGKTSIEDQMQDEIRDLLSDMRSAAQSDPDHIVDFNGILTVSIINILWAILCGKRYQRDDVEFKKLLNILQIIFRGANVVGANYPIPAFLIRLFPALPKMIGIDTRLFTPIQEFIKVKTLNVRLIAVKKKLLELKETIEEHLSTRSEGDAPRDFFDVYLDEMKEKSLKDPSTTFSSK